MMKNDNRVESSIYIAFNAIISERKESTPGFLLTLRRVRIVVRPCGRAVMFPRSALSCLARRGYSEAHCASSLRPALEPQLAPGFVDGDGCAVGEVQGTQARAHWQSHLFGHVRTGHNIHRIGNIARFRAE